MIGLIPAHAGKTATLVGGHDRGAGSSPLTRGKQHHDRHLRRADRLIPAHAGKTCSMHPSRRRARAHPRSRGENLSRSSWSLCRRGSSPLTRGKRRSLFLQGPPGAAHPRSRGENQPCQAPGRPVLGSSPLTRGKRRGATQTAAELRLIPAHAGKTWPTPRLTTPGWAHPRSRGENSALAISPGTNVGSSPLTRGKPESSEEGVACTRLIPAHAGKTRRGSHPGRTSAAHPRSRGENSAKKWGARPTEGSSPLTRGKLCAKLKEVDALRLIPAHAGKTREQRFVEGIRQAHPRSRGENCSRHMV